eukprot:scaffold2263_cov391-Prasinococcus_capsulatus_cf.AAC.11
MRSRSSTNASGPKRSSPLRESCTRAQSAEHAHLQLSRMYRSLAAFLPQPFPGETSPTVEETFWLKT